MIAHDISLDTYLKYLLFFVKKLSRGESAVYKKEYSFVFVDMNSRIYLTTL